MNLTEFSSSATRIRHYGAGVLLKDTSSMSSELTRLAVDTEYIVVDSPAFAGPTRLDLRPRTPGGPMRIARATPADMPDEAQGQAPAGDLAAVMPAVEACARVLHGDGRAPRAIATHAVLPEHEAWVLEKMGSPSMSPLYWSGTDGGHWTSDPKLAGHFASADAAERYGLAHVTATGNGPFRVAYRLRD